MRESPSPRASDRFAWLAFRKDAVELLAVLDADLPSHVQIGFTDFDAVIRLLNAPDRTVRMADLARAVSRSPSALTRMVGRLLRPSGPRFSTLSRGIR
jgi:hypothetical protein